MYINSNFYKNTIVGAYIDMNLIMEVAVRKHIVKCKIEGQTDRISNNIKKEFNEAYVEKIRNILKSSTLSKSEKLYLIGKLQEKLKN
ncbi:MAG: hypothetical protein J1D87_05700 [Lachnospiraceae bacterium]|nr:hypothetical protein [Lachnospiraceae bacterium]